MVYCNGKLLRNATCFIKGQEKKYHVTYLPPFTTTSSQNGYGFHEIHICGAHAAFHHVRVVFGPCVLHHLVDALYTRSLPNYHVQTPMIVMEPHGNRAAATRALAQYILALAAETHGRCLILFPLVNAPDRASVSQSQAERAQDEQRPRCHGQRLTQYINARTHALPSGRWAQACLRPHGCDKAPLNA